MGGLAAFVIACCCWVPPRSAGCRPRPANTQKAPHYHTPLRKQHARTDRGPSEIDFWGQRRKAPSRMSSSRWFFVFRTGTLLRHGNVWNHLLTQTRSFCAGASTNRRHGCSDGCTRQMKTTVAIRLALPKPNLAGRTAPCMTPPRAWGASGFWQRPCTLLCWKQPEINPYRYPSNRGTNKGEFAPSGNQ